MSKLDGFLRRSGFSITAPRRIVYECLMRASDHPTAARLYERLRAEHNLSRTSVYRALDLFVELGLATAITDSNGRQRFDRKTRPHFHAVCTRCGNLHDIDAAPPELKLNTKIPAGFSVQSVEVEVRGMCSACRTIQWKPDLSGFILAKANGRGGFP